MAGLPLYLMAIPLRKSLAAGMDDEVLNRGAELTCVGGFCNCRAGVLAAVALAKVGRLPHLGNRCGRPTIILTASNPANRQFLQGHCHHQSRRDRQCDDAPAGSELPPRVFLYAP